MDKEKQACVETKDDISKKALTIPFTPDKDEKSGFHQELEHE